jgi:hypothetical protein
MEVATEPAKETFFLNLLYVCDQTVTEAPRAAPLQRDGMAGFGLTDPNADRLYEVLFKTERSPGGVIQLSDGAGRRLQTRELSPQVTPRTALPGE